MTQTDLDIKLKDILWEHWVAMGTETGGDLSATIAQIKQAFKEAGYIKCNCRVHDMRPVTIPAGKPPYKEFEELKDNVDDSTTYVMTGAEWLERFKKELGILETYGDKRIIIDALNAAKKAAGVNDD